MEHFTIHGNGIVDLAVEASYFGQMSPVTFPRFGYEMKLNKTITESKWYGKGPGGSYKDRNRGM